ncbi:MAG: cation transporter, partial [Vulcanimicrobiaceae bacterium]
MAHAAHAGSGTNVRQTLAPLGIALGLTLAVVVLEIVGGLAAHSLALVADAAHAFMDALALGIALAAAYQARR